MSKKKDTNTKQMFPSKVPRIPEGYYSGDKPNPNLCAFVEAHVKERPYDPKNDDYDVPPFDKPIETTKATAIYNIHTYWSKKPHDAIRQYIEHYTRPGDLVLDPFCGSGGTALAALMEGRKAVAIDRSPAATFITKNYCSPVNVEELREAFEDLKRKALPEIDWLYETRCDRCDGKATAGFTVYSQVFQCPRCLEKVPLFDCIKIAATASNGKPKSLSLCPHCFKKGGQEVIRSQSQKFGAIPVMVSYVCESGCKPPRGHREHKDSVQVKRQYFEKYDLGKLSEIEGKKIPYWFPEGYDMTGFGRYQRDALYYYGVKEVADLFTKRNLWAIAAIKASITPDSPLNFCLSAILFNSSRMYRHRSGGGGGPKGTDFMIPQIGREMPVWPQMEEKVAIALKRADRLSTGIMISTQSACRMEEIESNSVDYIFTDPPYGGTIQYGELSAVWEAWQGYSLSWHNEEITINAVRGKSEVDWTNMMRQAMGECFRVLKPGHWLSLCYHDTSEGTWELVQDIMSEVGFSVDNAGAALFIDTGQKTYNQLTADKVTKRDLVINFRKPRLGQRASVSNSGGAAFIEKARDIIREYLEVHPGSTKDRVYDEVVSRLVRSGRMEAHNFEELLGQVAEEVRHPIKKNLFENQDADLFGTHEVGRWYLRETESGAEQSDQSAADDAASRIEEFLLRQSDEEMRKTSLRFEELQTRVEELKASLEGSGEDDESRKRAKIRRELREAEQQLEQLTGQRSEWAQHALHYTYVSEFYFPVSPKPRITLIELLEDYFYLTEQGNWRPPLNEEERSAKARLRNQAARRRLQKFCRLLSNGEPIPPGLRPDDSTLAEWIRYCKRSGLYQQGKFLFEKGGLNFDSLSDETQVGVEEDYQVCARMLARMISKDVSLTRGSQHKK